MTDNGGQEPHFDITKITAFEVIAHSAIKASEEQKITILSKEILTKLLTKRYTVPSSSVTRTLYVITLAPPDLPAPLDLIAILIFRIPAVNSTPCNGFRSSSATKAFTSSFKDL